MDKWLSTTGAYAKTHTHSDPLAGIYPTPIATSYFSPTMTWSAGPEEHDVSARSQSQVDDELDARHPLGDLGEEATSAYWNALIDGVYLVSLDLTNL